MVTHPRGFPLGRQACGQVPGAAAPRSAFPPVQISIPQNEPW
jgi:hypothetical protein